MGKGGAFSHAPEFDAPDRDVDPDEYKRAGNTGHATPTETRFEGTTAARKGPLLTRGWDAALPPAAPGKQDGTVILVSRLGRVEAKRGEAGGIFH